MTDITHSSVRPSGGEPAVGIPAGGLVIAVLTEQGSRAGSEAQRADLPTNLPTTVLVIDNDPEASARPIVERLAGTLRPGLVRYVHEPKPGIAAARNRALREAASSALLVFIDDDEVPSERWLEQLVDLQRSSGAAAVVGPVISE